MLVFLIWKAKIKMAATKHYVFVPRCNRISWEVARRNPVCMEKPKNCWFVPQQFPFCSSIMPWFSKEVVHGQFKLLAQLDLPRGQKIHGHVCRFYYLLLTIIHDWPVRNSRGLAALHHSPTTPETKNPENWPLCENIRCKTEARS